MDGARQDPPADAVRAALDRLLTAEPFNAAARQRQFLTYVVDEVLAGRGDLLKEWSIARQGLGEPTTFDPRTDPIVRVTAGRVRLSLARYYAGAGADETVRVEIPKGGYVPHFISTEPTSAVPELAGSPVIGPRVAVMAFRDLSPGAQPDYLAFGFTESLTGALARYEAVPVIGPLVEEAPDSGVDRQVAQAAKADADLLLTGTVRTVDGLTRLGVRLVDVATSAVRWSGTFDERSAPDAPFDAEDRIVEQLGVLLGDELGVIQLAGPAVPRTSDPVVYDAILQYYAYGRSLDQQQEPQVIESLELAHDHDPSNPVVTAMLAATTMFHGVGDAGGRPPEPEKIERAVSLALQAEQRAPGLPLAGLVLAFGRMIDGDPDGCLARIRTLLRARSVSPTSRSMCGIGLLLCGEWQEGIDNLRDALDLNPNHPAWQHGFLALDALVRGEPEEALEEARRVEAPGLVWGPLLRAAALGALGRDDERQQELGRLAPDALANALFSDRLLAHSRLPAEVIGALAKALPVEGS